MLYDAEVVGIISSGNYRGIWHIHENGVDGGTKNLFHVMICTYVRSHYLALHRTLLSFKKIKMKNEDFGFGIWDGN